MSERPPLIVRYDGVEYMRIEPRPSEAEEARGIEVVPVEALREVRAELVAPSGHPVVSAAWCARAIERIDDALAHDETENP